MDGRTDGWMDGWTDRWMDGWTDGWMDGWMDLWTSPCGASRGQSCRVLRTVNNTVNNTFNRCPQTCDTDVAQACRGQVDACVGPYLQLVLAKLPSTESRSLKVCKGVDAWGCVIGVCMRASLKRASLCELCELCASCFWMRFLSDWTPTPTLDKPLCRGFWERGEGVMGMWMRV
eukprot:161239-Chlamydomonas_euryale.AAC.3